MGEGASRWRKTKNGREPLDARMKQICARLRAGATYREIAGEFNVSIARVGQIREYAGIERRHKSREPEASSQLPVARETQNNG